MHYSAIILLLFQNIVTASATPIINQENIQSVSMTQLQSAAIISQVNWNQSEGCCDGQYISGIQGHFIGMPHGTKIDFYIADKLFASHIYSGQQPLYAIAQKQAIWIANGDAVWAKATYNNITLNILGAHRVQYGSNPWVDCSSGCNNK